MVRDLSIHPYGAINAALEPLKLDGRGVLVPNLGLMASYEFFLLPCFRKARQSGYFDCALQPSGISHLGFRGYFINARNTLIGRRYRSHVDLPQDMVDSSGYLPYSFYENAGSIDWAFLWYGGEFEWDQRLRKCSLVLPCPHPRLARPDQRFRGVKCETVKGEVPLPLA
jgi:hypothetical protein